MPISNDQVITHENCIREKTCCMELKGSIKAENCCIFKPKPVKYEEILTKNLNRKHTVKRVIIENLESFNFKDYIFAGVTAKILTTVYQEAVINCKEHKIIITGINKKSVSQIKSETHFWNEQNINKWVIKELRNRFYKTSQDSEVYFFIRVI